MLSSGRSRVPPLIDPTTACLRILRGITLYLQAGSDRVTLAKIAGHADPTITMSVYGHLLPDSERRAARGWTAS
jgi:hypothetical protein